MSGAEKVFVYKLRSPQQKDREFVQHLWDLFDSIGIVGTLPAHRSRSLKSTGKSYDVYGLKTLTFCPSALSFIAFGILKSMGEPLKSFLQI